MTVTKTLAQQEKRLLPSLREKGLEKKIRRWIGFGRCRQAGTPARAGCSVIHTPSRARSEASAR